MTFTETIFLIVFTVLSISLTVYTSLFISKTTEKGSNGQDFFDPKLYYFYLSAVVAQGLISLILLSLIFVHYYHNKKVSITPKNSKNLFFSPSEKYTVQSGPILIASYYMVKVLLLLVVIAALVLFSLSFVYVRRAVLEKDLQAHISPFLNLYDSCLIAIIFNLAVAVLGIVV